MKWALFAVALYLLLSLFAPPRYVFAQDAKLQTSDGRTIAESIMSNLRLLRLQITQLESESALLSGSLQTLDQQLRNSERLVSVLGQLVDDQLALYRKSLNKWRLLLFGLIGLLVIYNALKIYLRLALKIRIW